ncbi:lysophospholipid acyltransferase family protein [Verrucomicrobia bacterium]|nr:lysophospholipid acyltransferase family protein [Verrucomicrobiota bacterium]
MAEPRVIPKHQRPPYQPGGLERILGNMAGLMIKSMAQTVRFQFNDPHDVQNLTPVIFCIWHNRLALALEVLTRHMQKFNPDRRLAALASASKDGGFLSVVLQSYGVHAIRGSSSRRGSQAMREMIAMLRKGHDLAITPDGPRGPKYKVQSGVVGLAQITGMPIVPVSSCLSRKWTLKSWDAFQVPIPFCQCVVNIGKPLYVDRESSMEQREEIRQQLATEMLILGKES